MSVLVILVIVAVSLFFGWFFLGPWMYGCKAFTPPNKANDPAYQRRKR